ncbi:MAG: Oligopeptide ABC transporter, permease protein OppC (TC 3.A.1.5.1) [uncultured Paraburkholderia sp.]|nr:MAG: Oligopeptide ABC transporter, permease protein OppC (TC 3.A.1.5.1) [uncultured Paraburkholderia sp.]
MTRQVPGETESLDPAHIESWTGNTIALDLFEGLTRIDAAGAIVPGVAQSWTRTGPDTWVFKLRHDARWSNRQPVTANDFVYAWQRVLDPKTGSKYTVLVEFVKNAKAILAGKAQLSSLGVRAADPYTLEVTTKVPAAFFPQLTAMTTMAPVNRDVVTKFGGDWTRPGNFVGNGPYALADWQPGNRLVGTKSKTYWNASKVVITKVTYLPIDSDWSAISLPPTWQNVHWFGTDELGRDLLARTLQSGRVSLEVGLLGTLVSGLIGVAYGATAGYLGGRVDAVMMRIVDMMYAIPYMLIAILMMTMFGRAFYLVVLTISAFSWLDMARVVRGQTLSLRSREFIDAAKAIGVSSRSIIARHIVPNIVLTESVLSFLGLGVQEPMTSWGVLIQDGAQKLESMQWLLLCPAVMLCVTLYCVNFVGDGLRDAFDPKDR